MIRLFIIDDQFVIAGSLKKRLTPYGFIIAGESPDVESALAKIDPDTIDILILDLLIKDTDPVQNIKLLKSHFPEIPIVILSQEHAIIWQIKMCQEGARAFINKLENPETLAQKLHQVYNGQEVANENIADISLKKADHLATPAVQSRPSTINQSKKNNLWARIFRK